MGDLPGVGLWGCLLVTVEDYQAHVYTDPLPSCEMWSPAFELAHS